VPKSGSTSTRAKSTPTAARGFKGSPAPGGTLATEQLNIRTAASFANSPGCTLRGPKSSHLRAPPTSVPIPGIRTSTRHTSTARYNPGAYLRHAVYRTRLARKKIATPSATCTARNIR
jgi:hypothetical protein